MTIKTLKQPAKKSAGNAPDPQVSETVAGIIEDIRADGDAAVRKYSEKFDEWAPKSFLLGADEIERIVATVAPQVIEDIRYVQTQVRDFAQAQLETMNDLEVETLPGVFLGHRHLPVRSSGAYVPGGRYPLTASAHMTVVTAKVAGVNRVAACSPPIAGEIPNSTIAAMSLAGADEIYLLGGVQAIAALALGTETIERVDLLAGPGNAYVAEAKRQLFGEVGIDLPAGPTEILVVVDKDADPFVAAVDLLSQAEHGPDSPAVLISTDEEVARKTVEYVEQILPTMPTRDYAEAAWRDYGQVHVVANETEAFALADEFASEHVQILTQEPRNALSGMNHFGALFLGERTCVSYGDKVIGTNHVLPTKGAARYTGGLWVAKFLRTTTYQEVRDQTASAELGRVCGRASRVERFEGHARSGDVRAAKYGGDVLTWLDHPYQ